MELKKIEDILQLLSCVDCFGGIQEKIHKENYVVCDQCGRKYKIIDDGILQMMPAHPRPLPEMYNDQDYLKWRNITAEVVESLGILQKIYEGTPHRIIARRTSFEESDMVLDIGCGNGAHFPYYSDLSKVIGIDNHLPSLKVLKKKKPSVFLIHGDIYQLPFKDQVISDILIISVLEHIFYAEIAISEIFRVLKNSGEVWVGIPCEGGWLRDTIRNLTTVKTNSRKYNIDYLKVAKIEHCHSAKEIESILNKYFYVIFKRHYPFLIRNDNLNLNKTLRLKKRIL